MSALPSTKNAPTPGSNAAKNKKKRDKKKAKKRAAADPNAQSGISAPSLTDKDGLNPTPSNNDTTTTTQEPTTTEPVPLSGEASLTASSLPAALIEDSKLALGNTTASEVTPLSGDSSVMAASLPAPPIKEDNRPVDSDANKLASSTTDSNPATSVTKASTSLSKIPATGPVGVGAHGATAAGAAVVAATVGSASAAADSNNTDSATAKSNVTAPLPEAFPLSDNVQHCIQSAVASRSIDLDSIVRTIAKNIQFGDYKERAKLPDETSAKNIATAPTTDKSDIKKAAAGVGATVAGAGVTVAGATKANRSSSTSSEQTKLSDIVQHCIKSVVQAPSVNISRILHPSETVKRPEPAVGAPAQPVMPSSAKAPDVPKKDKPSEHRHKPIFLNKKKKDCIIL